MADGTSMNSGRPGNPHPIMLMCVKYDFHGCFMQDFNILTGLRYSGLFRE